MLGGVGGLGVGVVWCVCLHTSVVVCVLCVGQAVLLWFASFFFFFLAGFVHACLPVCSGQFRLRYRCVCSRLAEGVPTYCCSRLVLIWPFFFTPLFSRLVSSATPCSCHLFSWVFAVQAKLQEEPSDTPLQEKLDDMAAMIGYVGMACAAATFVATMCVYFTTHRVSQRG